ncbi:hypothetical protein E3P96_03906, partial [Wallemia ichthyophaga]
HLTSAHGALAAEFHKFSLHRSSGQFSPLTLRVPRFVIWFSGTPKNEKHKGLKRPKKLHQLFNSLHPMIMSHNSAAAVANYAYPVRVEGCPHPFPNMLKAEDSQFSDSHSRLDASSESCSVKTSKTPSPSVGKQVSTRQTRKERNRQNVANFRARQRITAQLKEEVLLLKKSNADLEQEKDYLNSFVFELQSALYNTKYSSNMFVEQITYRIV